MLYTVPWHIRSHAETKRFGNWRHTLCRSCVSYFHSPLSIVKGKKNSRRIKRGSQMLYPKKTIRTRASCSSSSLLFLPFRLSLLLPPLFCSLKKASRAYKYVPLPPGAKFLPPIRFPLPPADRPPLAPPRRAIAHLPLTSPARDSRGEVPPTADFFRRTVGSLTPYFADRIACCPR
jgi:hypothetical protein